MTRYRRSYGYSNSATIVTIMWSQKYSSYALKFQDTRHFKEMTPAFTFIKNLPFGEWLYDPTEKTWYFQEQHLNKVKLIIEAFGDYIFKINFTEKPVNNHGQNQYQYGLFGEKIIDINQYLLNFRTLTGQDITNLTYPEAKKIYRRFCIQNHPDVGGDTNKMSSVNEIWSELEIKHFKIREKVSY